MSWGCTGILNSWSGIDLFSTDGNLSYLYLEATSLQRYLYSRILKRDFQLPTINNGRVIRSHPFLAVFVDKLP